MNDDNFDISKIWGKAIDCLEKVSSDKNNYGVNNI